MNTTTTQSDKCAPKRLFCFFLDGEKFETHKRVVTPAQIRAIAGVPEGVPIVQCLPDGTQVQLGEDEKVELEKCHKFKKLPRFKRGFDRVAAELELVRRVHPEVERCGQGIIVRDFELPSVFAQDRVPILVPIPPTYPSAPPDNFFVPWGTSLRSGQAIQAYSGPVPLEGTHWGQFSHHIEPGAWRPSTSPDSGDNVLTYLLTVRGRLQQGA